MRKRTIFGDSVPVGTFANRRTTQAVLFTGLQPVRRPAEAREPLPGQSSLLDAEAAHLNGPGSPREESARPR